MRETGKEKKRKRDLLKKGNGKRFRSLDSMQCLFPAQLLSALELKKKRKENKKVS
jgi:hypothetical protein